MGRIFHVTTDSAWQAGRRAGRYTTSTRGRSLAAEGFIHASRADQWQQVRHRYYSDVTEPLVLLVIDTDLLEVPVIADRVPGTEDTYPHLYGPLNLNAVVQAVPLAAAGSGEAGPTETFSSVFPREVFRNAAVGLLAVMLAAVGVLVGRAVDPGWGAWAGLVVGVGCGAGLVTLAHRGRRTAPHAPGRT